MQPRTHLAPAPTAGGSYENNRVAFGAQTEPPPRPVVPMIAVDPSRPEETVSTRIAHSAQSDEGTSALAKAFLSGDMHSSAGTSGEEKE